MNLYEWLDRVESRPAMYFRQPGFSVLAAYIRGFEDGRLFIRDEEDPPLDAFGEFAMRALGQNPHDVNWESAILDAAGDEKAALDLFFRLLREYRGGLPPAESAVQRA